MFCGSSPLYENKVTHQKYIGLSNNIARRLLEHSWALNNNRHSNTHLQRSWNKYGKDNFDMSIIEECSLEELPEREKYWIKYYDSFNNGFNQTIGGEGNPQLTVETVSEVCNLFNTGKYSTVDIAKMLKMDRKRVARFLYFGTTNGLCNYDPLKSGTINVVCLTTGMHFESIKKAEEYYNINGVPACCKHKHDYCGIGPNGEKLIWMYESEYEQYSEEEINKYIFDVLLRFDKRIVCLNTLEIFESKDDAYKWCNLSGSQGILKCCNHKIAYSGKHPETGEYLAWEYYRNYINMSPEKITQKVNKAKSYFPGKRVICLNNGKIFKSSTQAADYASTNKEIIKNCCRGTANSAGVNPENKREPLTWVYEEDYVNMTPEEISDKILLLKYRYTNPNKAKPIICLNNLYVFRTQKEAGKWCKLANPSQIGYGIRKGTNYVGIHPETQEQLRWMYYDEYIKNNNDSKVIVYSS